MTIKFECSYEVDKNMYILCPTNRTCACPSGQSCLQVTPSSGLCFAGVLINFRAGKFQALDITILAKVMPELSVNFGMRICRKY